MNNLPANLKWFRENEGLTQQQLADVTEIHQRSIASYETGRANPSIDRLITLAQHFGVKIDELVIGKTE